MNKYFLIGMLTSAIVFAIYDITKTIEIKREIERNKKLRQKKYEQRLKESRDKWMTLKRN